MMSKLITDKPVVLFVDDEERVLKSLKRLLFYEPFEVKTAESASEALKILESSHIDIVISDEKMPEKSGSELLTEVRFKYPDVCRIMLTGQADLSSAMHAINEGRIFRFLLKPVELTDLIGAINDFLDERFKNDQKLDFSQEQAGVCSLDVSVSSSGRADYRWSANARRLLEIENGVSLDGMDTLYQRVHPDDLDRVVQANESCLISSQSPEIEFRLILPKGGERWISQVSDCLRRADGKGYSVVTIFQDVTAKINQRQLLHHLAYHDSLTGLGNRALFMDELGFKLKNTEPDDELFVLFMDIDDFKLVNDSMGHVSGDWLLNSFAARLRDIVPDEISVSRLGGDEFAIIVGTSDPVDAKSLAHEIVNSLQHPFIVENHRIHITVSIGVTSSGGRNDITVHDLLREADTAMYDAKGSKEVPIRYFEARMLDKASDRFQMTSELHQALSNREFFLEYQPVVDLKSLKPVGFEALVRWDNPGRGLIMPDHFIPLAESNGVIIDLGIQVAEMACRQIAYWNESNIWKDFFMSFNVSVYQIRQDGFVTKLKEIIQELKIVPEKLKIEVTESGLMDDVELSLRILNRIKELGIGIQIDDFGTGYSSLEYLQQIPAGNLKIDKSFVSGMDGNSDKLAIVKTIIDLANSVGMSTVAEGVETIEELAILRTLGCNFVQGYLFDRPLRPSEAGKVRDYKQFQS